MAMAMAMAMSTALLRPCHAPPSPARFCLPSARPGTRAARAIVASSCAADAASFSSDSAELPKSALKRKSVAGVDQDNLVDPWLLADRDSRFAEFFGVQIHYKIAHPPADDETKPGGAEKGRNAWKVDAPAVLLHGFGASLFSWQRVLKPLAAVLGSRVVAFDRPAFGLTARPKLGLDKKFIPNPYTLEFSANATLSFAEFLHAQQIILIGHSAGSLVALQAYLDAPEKVAAMILIAPAIAPPIIVEEVKKAITAPNPEEDKAVGREADKKFRLSNIVSAARDASWWVLIQVLKVLRIIKAAVQALFQTFLPEKFVARVESAIRNARERLVTAAFRSLPATWAVRVIMDRFGTRGVRMSWYDPAKADDDVLQGYTKPLRCKNWESALLEFALAMAVNPSVDMKLKISLGKRLKEVKCPVLVVTGDTDRLVPAWNARRLASALPNAEFELIKRCGHLPQEETPDELLSIIERFLRKAFPSDSISKPLHVPT